MMKYVFIGLVLISCASGPVQLSEKGKNVEVFATKPIGCKVTGRLIGEDKSGSRELALNDVLNQAGDLNSTGIFVNEEVPNGKTMRVFATSYKCD
jgi:hypothetical protein